MVPQLVTAAVVGALSPIPAMVTILLLSTPLPVWKTVALLVGWMFVLVVLAIVLFALLSPNPQATDHAAKAAVGLIVGLLLLAVGGRTLLGAHHPLAATGTGQNPSGAPKWMTAVETIKIWQALFLGIVLILISPADIAVFFAALQAIFGQHLGTANRAAVEAILLAFMSLSILAPLLVYVFMPRRSGHILDIGKQWLIAHQGAVSGWSALIFGGVMIINSLTTLA